MPRYRLLTKHYMYDQLLDEGTIVGDGTPFKIEDEMVSPDMEGLDDESKEKVWKSKEEMTKPLMAAPQIGMLYLEPDVKDAILDAARGQQGSSRPNEGQQRSVPAPSATREQSVPQSREPDRPQSEPKEGRATQLPNPPPPKK